MKVRMITTAAGPDGVYPADSVQDLGGPFARALVDGGYALPLEPMPTESETLEPPRDATLEPPETETAEPAAETAALPRAAKKTKRG